MLVLSNKTVPGCLPEVPPQPEVTLTMSKDTADMLVLLLETAFAVASRRAREGMLHDFRRRHAGYAANAADMISAIHKMQSGKATLRASK